VCDTVAGDTRLIVDDGDPYAREPVQHTALANVRAADDDDLRYAHEITMAARRESTRF
jgi:hypothetical protein